MLASNCKIIQLEGTYKGHQLHLPNELPKSLTLQPTVSPKTCKNPSAWFPRILMSINVPEPKEVQNISVGFVYFMKCVTWTQKEVWENLIPEGGLGTLPSSFQSSEGFGASTYLWIWFRSLGSWEKLLIGWRGCCISPLHYQQALNFLRSSQDLAKT